MATGKNPAIGSGFDNFLKEQGVYEQTTAAAVKHVLAWQLQQVMKKEQISKVEMARIMKTSRAQLDRILDPANDRVQLNTLMAAARAVGRELRIELV